MGKTSLSIALAKAVRGSIISADSMQVYRGLDIGSAKITEAEKEGIPHYLIDVLDPVEDFNVARFQEMALAAMEEIYAAGRLPIITGGTGFYIQALLKVVDFTEGQGNTEFRSVYEEIAAEQGGDILYALLKERDPASAESIHPHNVKRVIRALEYLDTSGTPISAHNREMKQSDSPFCYAYFVLNEDRQVLYDRIDRRVDQMIAHGLVEEVRSLRDAGLTEEHVSMRGLGYKELFPYLRGEIPLEEAVRIIKRDTRHFAKRQLTWFRREKDVIWINKEEFQKDEGAMLSYMLSVWDRIQKEDI